MKAEQNPGAGQATGVQEELQSTDIVARCDRCGHHITAEESLATRLGRDCRRHRARSAGIADRLVELAFGVDRLPLLKLAVVADALDAVEAVR